jgi:D-alanyl-D-alanine carboxypeptidase (penicillin-binding protein 5/6)
LLEWAFRSFERKTLVKQGEVVDRASVWLGKTPDVQLVAAKNLDVVLPRTRRSDVRMSVRYEGPVTAPVKKDTKVGVLKVEIPDQAPMEIDLLAANDVPRIGVFGRVKSRAKFLLSGVTE